MTFLLTKLIAILDGPSCDFALTPKYGKQNLGARKREGGGNFGHRLISGLVTNALFLVRFCARPCVPKG